MQGGTIITKSAAHVERRCGLLDRLVGWVERYMEERRNRRAIAQLLEYDDRLLTDIGVTRADVEFSIGDANPRTPADHLTECRQIAKYRRR